MNEVLPKKSDEKELTSTEVQNYVICILISAILFVIHQTTVKDMRMHYPDLHTLQLILVDYFFQYIGNNANMFIWLVLVGIPADGVALAAEKVFRRFDLKKIAQIIGTVGEIIPYAFLSTLFVYNIDTEYLQILPGSSGMPMLLDCFAGLFGMVAGAMALRLFFEILRMIQPSKSRRKP